jgi:hypothetical protein
MFAACGFLGMPETVLIDPNGKVAGMLHPADLRSEHLEDLLASKRINLPVSQGTFFNIPRASVESGPALRMDIVVRPASADGFVVGSFRAPGSFQEPNATIRSLAAAIYGVPQVFIEGAAADDPTCYDVSFAVPQAEDQDLRRLLPEMLSMALRIQVKRETRQMDGWILAAPQGKPDALKPPTFSGSQVVHGNFHMTGMDLSNIADMLQAVLRRPVENRRELTESSISRTATIQRVPNRSWTRCARRGPTSSPHSLGWNIRW